MFTYLPLAILAILLPPLFAVLPIAAMVALAIIDRREAKSLAQHDAAMREIYEKQMSR